MNLNLNFKIEKSDIDRLPFIVYFYKDKEFTSFYVNKDFFDTVFSIIRSRTKIRTKIGETHFKSEVINAFFGDNDELIIESLLSSGSWESLEPFLFIYNDQQVEVLCSVMEKKKKFIQT